MEKERSGKKGREKRGIRSLTAWLLGGMVVVLAVLFFLADKKEFSENENRYLEKLPAFHLEKVRSGEYMDWRDIRKFFQGVGRAECETQTDAGAYGGLGI